VHSLLELHSKQENGWNENNLACTSALLVTGCCVDQVLGFLSGFQENWALRVIKADLLYLCNSFFHT
jgi:hypothetical protein